MTSGMHCKHAHMHTCTHSRSAKQPLHGKGDNQVKNCNALNFHDQSNFKNNMNSTISENSPLLA